MAAGTPLKPEVRQAVVDDLRSGKYGRNEIATRNKVGRATVTRIAKEEELDPSHKTAVTQAATRAVAVDVKARREQLKMELMGDIERLRVRAWSPWSREVVTKEGIESLHADLPPLPEALAAYKAIAVCLDGVVKLEAIEAAQGDTVQGARDFLLDLREGMAKVREEFEAKHGVAFDSPEAQKVIKGELAEDDDAS